MRIGRHRICASAINLEADQMWEDGKTSADALALAEKQEQKGLFASSYFWRMVAKQMRDEEKEV